MKLFKRTSIFLIIFIALVWVFTFMWIYYPSGIVNATKSEIKQTEILLKENNISVDGEILRRKTNSISIPEMNFITQNIDLFEEYITRGKLVKESENSYKYDDNRLVVNGRSVVLEGYSDIIENNTADTAVAKAKKLISHFNLSKKNMLVSMQERNDGILVTFIPEYKNRPIFDCKISVMMYGAKEYKVEAVPYEISKKGSKQLPVTVCSALAELALDGKASYNEITEMTLGYKLDNEKLVPAWEIKTKEKNTFYIQ